MRKILAPALALTAAVALAGPAFADSPAPAPARTAVEDTRSELPAFAGHAYRLEVDNGVVFRNSYSADGAKLHWEALEGPMKGNSGNQDLAVKKVNDGVYHVNWVEESGMTVSHVMDLNSKTVSVYWTYVDGQGKRVGELHTASLTRIA
ncbi:MoaF-related domain-containing protein [Streptomyces sp. NBC_01304]|uniref:MoaF-related domain-containing protein n=1 Tax=Streptomyces sp. NBC_01304 TaxID=2903818 RepID=UPI002E141FF0|nr:MoaF N-terminal domain-containing protein [Streptomyces sp. NBC_01304]